MMPLPPSSSRPRAMTSRPVRVLQALTVDAISWVILPASCSLLRRQADSHMAWQLPSILASFSWLSCAGWEVGCGVELSDP